MKTCTKCKQARPLTMFSPGSYWCKPCRNEGMATRNKKLKETGARALRPERVRPLVREKKLTIDEWEKLWPVVMGPHYRFYFDILQSLGLRAHEGLSLRRDDFDFARGFVTIRTLKRKDTHMLELPVRPDILEFVDEWFNAPLTEPTHLFHYSYEQVLLAFKQAIARCGLNPRLGLHALRHLCGARLYMARATNEEIGYFLRHKPRSMQERYVEIPNDRLLELAQLMWEKQTWIWKTSTPDVSKNA